MILVVPVKVDIGKLTAQWQKMRPNMPVTLAPGVTAQRRDTSALYGLPPGRIWTAELTWTRAAEDPRLIIDLVEGTVNGRGTAIGRLMLHAGPPGRDWSAP